MQADFETKKELLLQEGYTCVMFRDLKVYTTKERGVNPLLQWLDSAESFQGFYSVDKVVGKAAAYLYVLLGISAVYALVVSEAALGVFERFGLEVSYEEKVTVIRNRDNTGFCPMEQSVWDVEDPEIALVAIRKKLEELRKK